MVNVIQSRLLDFTKFTRRIHIICHVKITKIQVLLISRTKAGTIERTGQNTDPTLPYLQGFKVQISNKKTENIRLDCHCIIKLIARLMKIHGHMY